MTGLTRLVTNGEMIYGEMTYGPSKEQQEAIDFFQRNPRRHMLISAVAGSGKTSLLRMLAMLVPVAKYRRVRYIAFSKEIVASVKKKLPDGFDAATLHSCGLSILSKYFKATRPKDTDTYINDNKYRTLADYWLSMEDMSQHPNVEDLRSAIIAVVNMARLTLTNIEDADALRAMADHFNIEFSEDDWPNIVTATRQVMPWGITGVVVSGYASAQYGADTMIDMTDMIYLPNVLPNVAAHVWTFNLLLVDECQDLSAASRGLVELLLGEKRYANRAVFVGDSFQAIMGFAGADCDSITKIVKHFNCAILPLTVCFRCASLLLVEAREINPAIQPAPGAILGEKWSVPTNRVVDLAQPGDMILSRTVAPLVSRCYEFLLAGKPAKLRGRDIGAGLVKLIESVTRVQGYTFEKFLEHLEFHCTVKIQNLSVKPGKEMQIQAVTDRWQSVAVIYDQVKSIGGTSAADVIAHIDSLFTERADEGVILCSAHKSKGLEARRVWIERYDLMPHPMAKQPWEFVQEMNLKYVALTRAQDTVFMVRDTPGGDIFSLLPGEPVKMIEAVQEIQAERASEEIAVYPPASTPVDRIALKGITARAEAFAHEGDLNQAFICQYQAACQLKNHLEAEPTRGQFFWRAAEFAEMTGNLPLALQVAREGINPQWRESNRRDLNEDCITQKGIDKFIARLSALIPAPEATTDECEYEDPFDEGPYVPAMLPAPMPIPAPTPPVDEETAPWEEEAATWPTDAPVDDTYAAFHEIAAEIMVKADVVEIAPWITADETSAKLIYEAMADAPEEIPTGIELGQRPSSPAAPIVPITRAKGKAGKAGQTIIDFDALPWYEERHQAISIIVHGDRDNPQATLDALLLFLTRQDACK